MTIKNPYNPPDYGMVNTAIERRKAEAAAAEKPSPKKSPAKKKDG